MNISSENRNGEWFVSLEGRLDTMTAPLLESALAKLDSEVTCLTFDCAKLSYISSAGLRVLLTAHKRVQGKMKLICVDELVMEVLEMTGFADVWVIE